MRRIQRFGRFALAVLLLAGAGCGFGDSGGASRLTPEETRLVEETLLLIRIRLEATRDPAAADEMRARAGALYTEEEREFLLARLAGDARRGELVMSALQDSLQAMRDQLFPASAP